MKEAWEVDQGNSMFTKAFIESIDSTSNADSPVFLGVES